MLLSFSQHVSPESQLAQLAQLAVQLAVWTGGGGVFTGVLVLDGPREAG